MVIATVTRKLSVLVRCGAPERWCVAAFVMNVLGGRYLGKLELYFEQAKTLGDVKSHSSSSLCQW
jgi:hypothetical protein